MQLYHQGTQDCCTLNPAQPTLLMTEATDNAISATLSHVEGTKQYPIFYASKTLDRSQHNYKRTDKECLAVICIWAAEMFKTTLSDKEFILETDQNALMELLKDDAAKE